MVTPQGTHPLLPAGRKVVQIYSRPTRFPSCCNDEGVPFSSVEYPSMSITLFLSKQPQLDSLHQFLPFPSFLIRQTSIVKSAPHIAFKATVFLLGGVAIGACLLHKIVDAHTFFDFMKLWAIVDH
ncbi:unnamed protein product [Linum trigynum]|uniref:Uncharacterized protein n=1 Tax=Linum trigynum TaxID=586398 RepID=A0AAV2ECI9_9ROSI